MGASVAFKFIRPRRDFRRLGEKVQEQLRQQLHADVAGMKRDFEKTTATWDHRVEFEERFREERGGLVGFVITNDEIYKFVDRGTRPHLIRAKHRMKPLTFATGYKAKTKPGAIGSGSGGASGPTVRALVVHHPGTEARRFSETIQDKWQKDLPRNMSDAVRKGVLEW